MKIIVRTRLQLLSTRYNQPQLRPHHSLDACHQDPALLLFNLEPLGCSHSALLFKTSLDCLPICSWAVTRTHHFLVVISDIRFCAVINFLDTTSLYLGSLGCSRNSWVFSWAGTSVLVTGNLYFRPTAGQAVYCRVIVSIDFGSRLYNCLLVSLSLLVVATHVSVLYFLNYCYFLSYFLFPNVPYCILPHDKNYMLFICDRVLLI